MPPPSCHLLTSSSSTIPLPCHTGHTHFLSVQTHQAWGHHRTFAPAVPLPGVPFLPIPSQLWSSNQLWKTGSISSTFCTFIYLTSREIEVFLYAYKQFIFPPLRIAYFYIFSWFFSWTSCLSFHFSKYYWLNSKPINSFRNEAVHHRIFYNGEKLETNGHPLGNG